ncbi:MAG: hypothetical protein WC269_05605 [Candidatus Gracilibacteria bacterium]
MHHARRISQVLSDKLKLSVVVGRAVNIHTRNRANVVVHPIHIPGKHPENQLRLRINDPLVAVGLEAFLKDTSVHTRLKILPITA